MVLENGTPGKDVIDEGRVRLSLTDVIYGIVIGYGFNILAAEDPSGVKPLLFALVVWIIVSDWAFVHMMYWREHEKYTFWPFTIDLAILLNFAVMTRFALKPDHSYLPLVISVMFVLYAIWDVLYGGKFEGRNRYRDFFFDSVGAGAFFALWMYMDKTVFGVNLGASALFIDFRHLPDLDFRWWIICAFFLYLVLGAHWFADKLKSVLWPWG
jgi:hypothetical protein